MTSSAQVELRRLAEVEASRKAWEKIARELAKIRVVLEQLVAAKGSGE